MKILGKLKRRNTSNSRNRLASVFRRSLFNVQHPHLQQFQHLRHLQQLQYHLQQTSLSNVPPANATGLSLQPPVNGQLPFPIPPQSHPFGLPSSNLPTAGSTADTNSPIHPNMPTNAVPISANGSQQSTSQLNPFLAAAAQAAKGLMHPFHQINNRLLNVPQFLSPNQLPSSSNQMNNGNNLLTINNKATNSNNPLSNTPQLNKERNDNLTNLKDNLGSNASCLHLQPFLRSLSAATNPLLPSNFPMLPQSMHQLLHPLFANNLDAAMLNQSANQINHSLNSNSSLISNSSPSSFLVGESHWCHL